MNERQRAVLGTTVVAIVIALLFFVPWRVESTDEIKWAPFYREPVAYVTTYQDRLPGSRMEYRTAEIAVGLLVLEVLAIGAAGGAAFALTADRESGAAEKGDLRTDGE